MATKKPFPIAPAPSAPPIALEALVETRMRRELREVLADLAATDLCEVDCRNELRNRASALREALRW